MAENIKVFALGGLDEKGKNLYILEINENIFVVEAGIKFPDRTLPGVDVIIPDYQYLKQNRDRVRGYFISHGHCEQMGALPYIYKDVPAPIYCTKATAKMIEKQTGNVIKKEKYIFNIIDPSGATTICGFKFQFFQTAHSAIQSCGFAIETSLGSIVYTGDFIVEYNIHKDHKHDLNKLAKIAEKDILLLMSESVGAELPGYTSPYHRLKPHLYRVLQETKGRVYVSLFDKNIYGFGEVITAAIEGNKKIIFYNQYARETYEFLSQTSSIVSNRNVCASPDDLLRMKEQDIIIVLVNQGENMFDDISELARGEIDDKRFLLSPNDTFLVACPPVSGLEVQATAAIDDLYKTGAHIVNLKRKEYAAMNAREEDLKTMLSLLKPKYYMPVSGEYRQLLANAKIATNMGSIYNHTNVFVLDNGMVVEINEGKARLSTQKIKYGDLIVDGIGVGDVRGEVINDRQKLSDDGVIILALAVSKSEGKIIAGPDVQMRGFVFVKESENVLKELTKIFVDAVTENLAKRESMDSAKNSTVDKSIRYVRKETGRDPMIVAIVEELE